MTDKIDSYGEFEARLTELLQQAHEGELDPAMIAGVLLDYRDQTKIKGELPEKKQDDKS